MDYPIIILVFFLLASLGAILIHGFSGSTNKKGSGYEPQYSYASGIDVGNRIRTEPYLKSVKILDYNESTRNAKIEFVIATPYKKVISYKQVNYQRYPTKVEWRERTKKSIASLRLTNDVLENLEFHKNELISKNAKSVVDEIVHYNSSLAPSWYQKQKAKEKYNESIKNEKCTLEGEMVHFKMSMDSLNAKYKKYVKKLNKIDGKISLAKSKNQNTIKIEKLEEKRNVIVNKIPEYFAEKTKIEKSTQDAKERYDKKVEELKENMEHIVADIVPLNTEIVDSEDYTPLSVVMAYSNDSPRKGCYIIHNVENNKYYVGQSKDILKRLHQHFVGTKPKNIIFAEDYFKSKNPDNLFEVRFVFCETKDELDETERFYIEKYDAFRNGYNGTAGNI